MGADSSQAEVIGFDTEPLGPPSPSRSVSVPWADSGPFDFPTCHEVSRLTIRENFYLFSETLRFVFSRGERWTWGEINDIISQRFKLPTSNGDGWGDSFETSTDKGSLQPR